MPPPASTPGALRLRSRNFPPPPPRADASTDSATSTPRNRLRLRPREGDDPPQRTMPRRTVSTPIGGPAQQQPLATPQRQPLTEYHGQSRLREDRSLRWEQSGEGREQRVHPERSRSRQWQLPMPPTHPSGNRIPTQLTYLGVFLLLITQKLIQPSHGCCQTLL